MSDYGFQSARAASWRGKGPSGQSSDSEGIRNNVQPKGSHRSRGGELPSRITIHRIGHRLEEQYASVTLEIC